MIHSNDQPPITHESPKRLNIDQTAHKSLDHILEEKLEQKLKSINLPQNAAKHQPAKDAYLAGWKAAVDVAADQPDTHPADRRRNISPSRLDQIVDQLPQTGYGWLSGAAFDLRPTCRQYARHGYDDSVEYAARIGWQDFIETNPGQAETETLDRRKKALDDIYFHGSTDIFTRKKLEYMPRTEYGNRWMQSLLEYGFDPV